MRTRVVSLLLVVASLAGCGGTDESPLDTALFQLSLHRQKWAAEGIHNYSFDYDFTAMVYSPPVLADSARIQQVLSNLVGNAVKFTPRSGRITVCAEQIAEEVRFGVIDTGPGIPAEQLPHIFGRFWQATASDRRGIGLGLAIAKGIVEAHNGRIWVESHVGLGSTFYFTLPSATEKAA